MSQRDWQARDDSDIDHYIQSGAFGYRQGSDNVVLEARSAQPITWLLQVTPLSDQQTIVALPNDAWYRLTAQLPDDQQTL